LHLNSQAPWSDAAVLSQVQDLVLPAITCGELIAAWILDNIGFPKRG
jgi:SRSO17 transposase